MRPALSVAMILRDEADVLPGCLAALEPLAAEIVAVDTGSTDATPRIAAEAGCIVGHFAWCDDFAAARNASLERCTAPWILVVDADERIAAHDAERMRSLAQQGADRAYRITTRNYSNDGHLAGFQRCAPDDAFAQGFLGWTPSTKVRLFPNSTSFRFEGVVHELVNPSLERAAIPIEVLDTPIHHYPLLKSAARLAAKRERYLDLGRAKAESAPDDPKAHAELGHQLLELGQVAEAIRAYKRAVQLAPESGAWLKDLGSALLMAGQDAAAEQALRLAVVRAPDLADAWRNLGVLLAGRETWRECAACFERAVLLEAQSGELWRYYGVALAQLGDYTRAAEAARQAIDHHASPEEAEALYRSCLANMGKEAEA